METKRVTTFSELIDYLPYLVRSMEKINETAHTKLKINEALTVIRSRIGHPDFYVMFAFVSDVVVGSAVFFVGQDFYGENIGHVWLIRTDKTCDSKQGFKLINSWFREKGVKRIITFDSALTTVKDRLLRRYGFKLNYKVWEKELY